MNKLSGILVCILSLIAFKVYSVDAQKAIKVNGVVFNDKNCNNIQDRGEAGIKDVVVWDGENCVATNKHGIYELETNEGRFLTIVNPIGYSFDSRQGATPLSYLIEKQCYNFPLHREKCDKNTSIALVGDVQVNDIHELEYANHTLFNELANLQFNSTVFMGDLVNESPDLFQKVRRSIEKTCESFATIYGNHDRDLSFPNQRYGYRKSFGADSYALNENNVLLIALNNVMPKGARGYEGRIEESQLDFVKSVISKFPNQMVVVTFHIPLKYTKNGKCLLELFKERKHVLFVSAHMHRVSRHFWNIGNDQMIQEINVGATCGSFWTGEKDWKGIPAATMQCGTPRGYFVLNVDRQRKYKFRFKQVGGKHDVQLHTWLKTDDTLSVRIPKFEKYDSRDLFLNLYGGSELTRVELQVDDREFVVCQKVAEVDPYVARLSFMRRNKIYPTSQSKKPALGRSKSDHLWHYRLADEIEIGVHLITVKAFDEFGYEIEEKRIITVK